MSLEMVVVFPSDTAFRSLQFQKLTLINLHNLHISVCHVYFYVFIWQNDSDDCYCYNMFISQLTTYSCFLFGVTLSITRLVQGALYAFKADTISVLGFLA